MIPGIGRIALDVRFGCLDDTITNADTQIFIDAVNTFFKNVGVLELKIPFWKIFNTPTWKKYVNSLDTITRLADFSSLLPVTNSLSQKFSSLGTYRQWVSGINPFEL